MAAGVVDTLWNFEELFDRVMGSRVAMAAWRRTKKRT